MGGTSDHASNRERSVPRAPSESRRLQWRIFRTEGEIAFQRQNPPGYPDPIRSARTQQYLHLVGLPSPSLGLAQPLPHFGGRSAFQRQDLPSYPDPVHSSAVGDSKKRFKGRFAVDIVCKPFDATVPTMNKGWREAAMSARMNVETAMSRGSRFWQLEHAAWSVVMQPSDPS
jgi:hypothetical protein